MEYAHYIGQTIHERVLLDKNGVARKVDRVHLTLKCCRKQSSIKVSKVCRNSLFTFHYLLSLLFCVYIQYILLKLLSIYNKFIYFSYLH